MFCQACCMVIKKVLNEEVLDPRNMMPTNLEEKLADQDFDLYCYKFNICNFNYLVSFTF